MRIGYLIPEFPGQTHAFFWRERQALKELGVETDVISTFRPPQEIVSHDWAKQAQNEVIYLVPPSFKDALNILMIMLGAGFTAWLNCSQKVIQADDVSFKQRLRLIALLPVAAKLVWLSKVQGWSHIHVHSCANSADIALFASLLSKISYSLTQHGPGFDTYGPNQSQKWQHASFGILVSDLLLQESRARLGSALPKRVSVVPMGVDLEMLARDQPYVPWQKKQPCQIFTIGRLNPVKGHDDLIEAVAILVNQGFDIYLRIAGEDELGGKGYRLHLESILQEKKMTDRVRLLGAVSEKTIRQQLQEAHVFALSSLNEGTSVAVMEAMAMELPVVATAVGGTPKLITDGVDGILVEPKKSEEMASAIAKVLMDSQLALNLGKAARQTIAERYHHRRSAEVLAEFLQGK